MLKSLVKGIQKSIRKGITTVYRGTFVVINHVHVDATSEVHRSQCGHFYAVSSGLNHRLAPREVYVFGNPKKGFWYARGIQKIDTPEHRGVFGRKIAFKASYGQRIKLLISYDHNFHACAFEYTIGFKRWGFVEVVKTGRVYNSPWVRSVVKMDVPYHDRYIVALVEGIDSHHRVFVTVAPDLQKYPVSKEVCEAGYTPVNFCLGFNHLYVLYQREGGHYLLVKYHVRKDDFILEVTTEYANQFEDTGLIDQNFGASMVLSCNNVLVGAPGADNGLGCIYVFEELKETTGFFKLKLNEGVGVGTQLFSDKKYINCSEVITNDKSGMQIYLPTCQQDTNNRKVVINMQPTETTEEEKMATVQEKEPTDTVSFGIIGDRVAEGVERFLGMSKPEDESVTSDIPFPYVEVKPPVNQGQVQDESEEVTVRLEKDMVVKLHSIATTLGMTTEELCQRILTNSDLVS